MKKSRERIAIETMLAELDARMDVLTTQIQAEQREVEVLRTTRGQIAALLGTAAAEKTPETPPPVEAKPKRGRKPRAPKEAPVNTVVPSFTHHCPSCDADVTATIHRGIAMCPRCESIEVEPLPQK